MTLTSKQMLDQALTLYRGATDQSDEEARLDASTAVNVQASWSLEDKAKVLSLFERLLATKDDLPKQQELIEGYLRTE